MRHRKPGRAGPALFRASASRRDCRRGRAAARRGGGQRCGNGRGPARRADPAVGIARGGGSRGTTAPSPQARLRPCAGAGAEVNRRDAERRGRGAETLAAWWLRLHGWRILARRARVPGGEVDIVARRGTVLAFIEVKARRTSEAAAMSLDAWRLRRVVVAAERLAPRYLRPGDDVRIDAIFIVPGRLPHHMPNIWHG